MLKDDALLLAIEGDFESAAIGPGRAAMLGYAAKLTRAPASVTRRDVDGLRDVGWSDLDVLHMAEVVGYYAYVNRIANGLGVEVEEEE